MPSLDRVTAPASAFLTGDPPGITLWDLAYEEYVHRELAGEHNTHVELYFTYLAHL